MLRSGFEAKPLADYISRHTPIPVPYKDPIDLGRYITYAVASMSALLVLRYLAPVLQNRWTWAVVTILTCLVMTSGFMFTRIRNSPYSGGNGQWVAAGYSNQFGQEVHVLAFICKHPSRLLDDEPNHSLPRWSSRCCIPHVDRCHSKTSVTKPSKTANISLDSRHTDSLFHSRFNIQSEEQRYVSAIFGTRE